MKMEQIFILIFACCMIFNLLRPVCCTKVDPHGFGKFVFSTVFDGVLLAFIYVVLHFAFKYW